MSSRRELISLFGLSPLGSASVGSEVQRSSRGAVLAAGPLLLSDESRIEMTLLLAPEQALQLPYNVAILGEAGAVIDTYSVKPNAGAVYPTVEISLRHIGTTSWELEFRHGGDVSQLLVPHQNSRLTLLAGPAKNSRRQAVSPVCGSITYLDLSGVIKNHTQWSAIAL